MTKSVPAALVFGVLLFSLPAQAGDVSAEEFRHLATDAPSAPVAESELMDVSSVNGRRADVQAAFATDDAGDRRSRLLALAVITGATSTKPGYDHEVVRNEIERILASPKYATQRGFVFSWRDRFFSRIFDWIDRFLSAFPGGPDMFFFLLAAVILGLAAFASLRLGQRRNRQVEARLHTRQYAERGLSPSELEARANRAALDGDYREAVRLRFVAGLLRLHEQKAIEYSPGITSAEVAATLSSRSYEALAADFDAIVYGDRPARSDDDQQAVNGWRQILEEASR